MSNGNEPAYPVPHVERISGEMEWGSSGLTKREAMAMHIMAGLCSGDALCSTDDDNTRYAVRLADALLAELERTGK